MSESPSSYKTVAEFRVSRTALLQPQGAMQVTIMPDDSPAIQAALNLFDAQSGASESSIPSLDEAAAGIAQFVAVAEPQETKFIFAPDERRREDLPAGAFIERDAAGQVTRTRSSGGDISIFTYDNFGLLERFSYAGMDWRKDHEGFWNAQDRQSDFKIDGQVEVLGDGSIKVSRSDMCRTVKLSGMRVDEYTNGSQSESRKIKNSASPYDILAKAKPIGSVWKAAGTRAPGHTTETRVKLENLFREPVYEGIPESVCNSALSALCDAAANEVTTPEPDDTGVQVPREKTMEVVKLHTTEYFSKAALWLCDKVKGGDTVDQIPYLDRLAEIYMRKRQFDLAELTYLRSLHIKEQFYGLRQPELSPNLFGLAQVHREWGNLQRSEQFFQQALELYDKGVRKQMFMLAHGMLSADKVKPNVESMIQCIMALFALYENQMKISAGNKLCNKAVSFWAEIREKHGDTDAEQLFPVFESHVIELTYKGSEAFGFQPS